MSDKKPVPPRPARFPASLDGRGAAGVAAPAATVLRPQRLLHEAALDAAR
jgi:hypothetical protein